MTIAAVLFDCDGTLVDSETLGVGVIVEMAAELGVILPTDEAHERFAGSAMSATLAEIERRLGRPLVADFEARLRERMARRFEECLEPIDGAVSLLEALTLPRAVVTNGPRHKMELTLRLTGLDGYFGTHTYTAYEVGTWKPEPGIFLHAASRLGVAPGRCAVVEDSVYGIEAGLAAGMRVFALGAVAARDGFRGRVVPLRSLPELLGHLPPTAVTS